MFNAIALAIRYACPIFTYEEILVRAGIIINSSKEEGGLLLEEEEDKVEDKGLASYSVKKLEKLLQKAIEEEDYEKASEIRDDINKRKTN